MHVIRVILADDHPIVRSGVRKLLETAADIKVVGEATNGEEALRLTNDLKPDVLILDIEMKGMKGVDVARQLRSIKSAVRVLVLSAYKNKQYVTDLLESGVAGYLVKDEAMDTIVEAVQGVARGETGWFSREITAQVTQWAMAPKESEPDLHSLTDRETQVLRLLATGLDNPTIAQRLSISEGTVKNHVSMIYSKIHVNSRSEAAAWAWRKGLVISDD
jgi:two-component system, NarL family, response regulator LiaR